MITNNELKILHDDNLADNNVNAITPAKLREVTENFVDSDGSWSEYVDSVAGDQVITAGVWTELTNDGADAATDETYLPNYATTLFSNNRVDLTDVPEGRVVTVKVDLIVTTLSNNTEVDVRVQFRNSVGDLVFNEVIDHKSYKSAGTREYVDMYMFANRSSVEDGSMALEVNADNNINIKFKAILISL